MKLVIALYTDDTTYNERLSQYAERYMADEFLVVNREEASGAHILLISEEQFRKEEAAGGPFRIVLSNVDGVDRIDGTPAVYRYQAADSILQTARRIFLEQNRYESTGNQGGKFCCTALFLSPAGGVGTSTMAMSMAIHAAQAGMRVVLLDLTQFSGLGAMIRPVEQGLSEVLFALKMKKNLRLNLSELLKEDISGFRYFGITERLQDMSEITADDIRLLVRTLKEGDFCDLLVIDADCRLDNACDELINASDRIFLVSDGRETSNLKTLRYAVMLRQERKEILDRVLLLNNGSAGRDVEKAQLSWIRELGSFPTIREASPREIAEQFSMSDLWNQALTR